MKPPTLAEAIEVLNEYSDAESYVDANYHQWMAPGFGMDDNSIDLDWYWRECNKLVNDPS